MEVDNGYIAANLKAQMPAHITGGAPPPSPSLSIVSIAVSARDCCSCDNVIIGLSLFPSRHQFPRLGR